MSSDSRSASDRRRGLVVAAGLFSLVLSLLLFEIGCQVYSLVFVKPRFEKMHRNALHYYRRAENPILGYELRPNTALEIDDRTLRINRWGVREHHDDLAEGRRKIAILGDSVTFGISHSQERTISALLQQEIDPDAKRVKVLNFGTPGYSIAEIAEFMRVKDAIYDVDAVIYLLNPNDFARRNSIYEGADVGIYRSHNPPLLKSPWFLRKLVYRMHRKIGGELYWYRWLFEGNEEIAQGHLNAMASYAAASGIDFFVVLLPSGLAYENGGYALSDMYERIADLLRREQIPYLEPRKEIGADPAGYINDSDHMHDAGNVLMSQIMARIVDERAW